MHRRVARDDRGVGDRRRRAGRSVTTPPASRTRRMPAGDVPRGEHQLPERFEAPARDVGQVERRCPGAAEPGRLPITAANGDRYSAIRSSLLEWKPRADQRARRLGDRRDGDRLPRLRRAAARVAVNSSPVAALSTTPASSVPSTTAAIDTAYHGNRGENWSCHRAGRRRNQPGGSASGDAPSGPARIPPPASGRRSGAAPHDLADRRLRRAIDVADEVASAVRPPSGSRRRDAPRGSSAHAGRRHARGQQARRSGLPRSARRLPSFALIVLSNAPNLQWYSTHGELHIGNYLGAVRNWVQLQR